MTDRRKIESIEDPVLNLLNLDLESDPCNLAFCQLPGGLVGLIWLSMLPCCVPKRRRQRSQFSPVDLFFVKIHSPLS